MLFTDTYLTIESNSQGEFKDKGSKFIGFAYAIKTEEEGKEIIKQLKKDHPQANHHCWAMVLGANKEFQKSTDDREPANTAGKPILRAILQKDLTYVLVVVVRYFGGKLLGVPGLINAYHGAGIDTLTHANIIEKQVIEQYEVEAEFILHNQLYKVGKNNGIKLYPNNHLNTNSFIFEVRKAKADDVLKQLNDAGICQIKFKEII
ncbi:MAG: IMPACT family protein [Bacteroidia bacterium]|nr:IMPACT family protein [Bacteroidia bacterium]